MSRDFIREWFVKPAVLLRDDDKGLTRSYGSGYTPPGLIEQAAPANHGHELFGTIVTCYSARHRLQPRAVSSCKYDCVSVSHSDYESDHERNPYSS